jgi:hypothetical protein
MLNEIFDEHIEQDQRNDDNTPSITDKKRKRKVLDVTFMLGRRLNLTGRRFPTREINNVCQNLRHTRKRAMYFPCLFRSCHPHPLCV